MDRRAGGIAAALLLLAVPAAAADLPLRALRWFGPEVDRVAVLTTAPAECLAMPTSPMAQAQVEIGRAAFRSPLLLGGQAARAGLACESCHRNGRGNPDFRFPGISGAAGTADVTSSLFSKKRGDGVTNPKPIPDLASDPRKITPAQMRAFVEGLVVDEFDGAQPPAAVLDGLVAYVGALRSGACTAAKVTITATTVAGDARRAVAAARGALASGDDSTAAVLLLAARAQLGLLNERYAGAALAHDRAQLSTADAALAAALAAVRRGDAGAGGKLERWDTVAAKWMQALVADEGHSLFDRRRLMAVIHASDQ